MAEGTFITQLLSGGGSSATAVEAVADLYHLLLEGLPLLTGAMQQGSSILSALAFGCNILQQLWRSNCAIPPVHIVTLLCCLVL